MNRVHIICHKESGSGKGLKVWNEVTEILNSFRLSFLSYFTDTSNSADLIVQQIMNRNHTPPLEQIIVIGGDGTLHEVVTALVELELRIPITYIASGSGNDFNHVWSRAATPRDMIETMIYSRTAKEIPVLLERNLTDNTHSVVVNSVGFGFDAAVNYNRQQLSQNNFIKKFVGGKNQYRLALALTLPEIPHFNVTAKMDGKVYYFDNASLVIAMNHGYIGGGLLVDNTANPEKSEIALAIYHDIDLGAVGDILPRVFKSHDHHESEYITLIKGQHLQLFFHDHILGQIDGEPLVKLPHEFEFTVSSYPFYLPE